MSNLQKFQALFTKNKTSQQGLTKSEAQKRLLKNGYNQLDVKKKEPLWLKFLHQFTDLMVIILIVAALIAIAVALIEKQPEELTDAYIILGIVFLNAIIGFVQEFKAEKALEALQNLIAPQARVLRDGTEIMIDAKELVVGDIMILAEGDKVGADAELFEANELKVEQSALTGESVPVQKMTDFQNQSHKKHNAENMVYMGTAIASGSGKAVIVKTGMQTAFGKIAHMTVTTTKDKSPLQKELHKIGIFVGKVTLVVSLILFLVGIFLQGYTFVESLLFSVAVAVAAVPEGLPATITIALALGVQRLAQQNAIIKQLSSVETLGSTTVICSDKTGTLTKNEMTVTRILLGADQEIQVEGIGYVPEGKILFPEKINQDDFQKFIVAGALCNEAKLVKTKQKWQMLGDPTEGSLLVLAQKGGFDLAEKEHEKLKTFPFDSVRKRMSTLVKNSKKSQKKELFVKGAPDSILQLCTHLQQNGKIIKLTPKLKTQIEAKYSQMAEEALRVLAIAYRENVAQDLQKTEDAEKNLIFLGLAGMIDPPRPAVKPAVKLCHKAGIRTIIITGDYGPTAKAIACKINLADRETPVVTGEELENLAETDLICKLQKKQNIIFARVAPSHKKRIVNALKQLGEIVAVTGDGVNDAPALKRADIGIAMGITGTDVSKEASNMILTDDSFASIITAVKEGRRIYQNLRKFVWYIFSTNIGELTTIFLAIILGIPSPLTAILILIINLGTDILPALALGVDHKEKGIMSMPPRDPKSHIMNLPFVGHFSVLGFIMGIIVICVYVVDLLSHGWQWGEKLNLSEDLYLHASTMAFVTLVLIQIVNAFNARSVKESIFKLKQNYYLWGASFVSVGMVIFMVNLEWLRTKMKIVQLSPQDWFNVILISLIVLVLEETRKIVWKNFNHSST